MSDEPDYIDAWANLISPKSGLWGHSPRLVLEVPCKHNRMDPHDDHEWYVRCEGGKREVYPPGRYRIERVRDVRDL